MGLSVEVALPQLDYALPMLRLMGVDRVRAPYGPDAYSDELKIYSLEFEPKALRAEPEFLRRWLTSAMWGLLPEAGRGVVSIDVSLSRCTNESEELGVPSQSWGLTPTTQAIPPDDGLSSFLLGVWYAPLGHLILADWLEEHRFGPSALTSALRESAGDPSLGRSVPNWHVMSRFRWRWLAADLMLYSCRAFVGDSAEGIVLGFLHAPTGRVPRRWAHWIPEGEAAQELAREMGMLVRPVS